jgi:hypothetical protein
MQSGKPPRQEYFKICRSNDFDSILHVKYWLDWHDDDRSGDRDDFGNVSGNKHRIDRFESDNKAGDGEHVDVKSG